MQKWQYLTVNFYGVPEDLHPDLINDVIQQDIKSLPRKHDFINQLGAEGWELVTVDSGTLYFKRPVLET